MTGPDPMDADPMPSQPRVGFLKPRVTAANVEIGAFTDDDDPKGPERFYETCVHDHFPCVGDWLPIGKFCAIAQGASFMMNGANHAMAGFSTYPFSIFGGGSEAGFDSG